MCFMDTVVDWGVGAALARGWRSAHARDDQPRGGVVGVA